MSDEQRCTSCNKPFMEHEGVIGICWRYEYLLASLRKIVTESQQGDRPPRAAREIAKKIEAAMKASKGEQ